MIVFFIILIICQAILSNSYSIVGYSSCRSYLSVKPSIQYYSIYCRCRKLYEHKRNDYYIHDDYGNDDDDISCEYKSKDDLNRKLQGISTSKDILSKRILQYLKISTKFVVSTTTTFIATSSKSTYNNYNNYIANAITIADESKLYNINISITNDNIYSDVDNEFTILLADGWRKYPKAPITLRLNEILNGQIKFADTLFVAKNFAEGTIMSITKSKI